MGNGETRGQGEPVRCGGSAVMFVTPMSDCRRVSRVEASGVDKGSQCVAEAARSCSLPP
ncbi:hypothetical protein PI95_017510 [Hassallia byssoidea VB512170]|uniref:Uncharacterized protein n=1 Tax=Hassallia byssoidea VB512170 TaxID=1304833 RepID=A0A846H9R2_9CYAN|nr:hypothetical protein [Hassalia byssoidea VB512170]